MSVDTWYFWTLFTIWTLFTTHFGSVALVSLEVDMKC